MTDQDPTPDAPTARIKRIEVIGLFGLYDHVIDLNLEDRVTILHGPNGVGKTVLLQMISDLLSSRIDELAQVFFQKFSVEFTDGDSATVASDIAAEVQQLVGRKSRTQTRNTKVVTFSHGEQAYSFNFSGQKSFPAFAAFEKAGMHPSQIGRRTQQFPGIRWSGNSYDVWGPDRTVTVHIIETQRISRPLNPEERGNESATNSLGFLSVWNSAIDLERRIASRLKEYGAIAQELDQSFPTRLIQRTGHSLAPQELKLRMSAVESLRAALQSNGILDQTSDEPFNVADLDNLSPAKSDVMALYVEDNEKKLGVFSELLKRIELLTRIVNSRFRNKTIRADQRQGLVALDHRGHPLELRSLSSGEQQQIIILYDLLFRVKQNTLVLIDEPELSLHVLWQKRFLPDLLEIVQVAGIDVIVATHSPFIVGDRSDLMVALDAEIDHDEPLQS